MRGARSRHVPQRKKQHANAPAGGVVPVAEQETTGEGDDEEDDREHQFKLLIFVFVGKSASRSEVNVMNTRGLKAI